MADDRVSIGPIGPKHDGWQSRKVQLTIATMAIIETISTAAWLVLDKLESAQWVSLNQWLVPLLMGVYSVANVMEKR